MIWLPGAYHSAQNFLDEGFARAAAQRRAPLDLRFVDLQMQHLDDRDIFQRLRSEIVLPARDSGAAVWLAGVSLGGLIALDYASSYPNELDGLCLFAPYLGNRMLINEIAAASGLGGWQPGELAESDAERRIWRYIKTRVDSRSCSWATAETIDFLRLMTCWPPRCRQTGLKSSGAVMSGAHG